MAEIYDIVIIGGGAAGFTAGIYAARDRCQALLLERVAAGGQVLNCEHIENYPGFPEGVAGYTLGPLLQQQAVQLGLGVRLADVEAVRLEGELKVLQTGDGEVQTRALIIATGSGFTPLGVPGEEAFLGRGVSHCAACDGAMFMEQPVAVIGGGDAALDEALYLTQYASQVTIVLSTLTGTRTGKQEAHISLEYGGASHRRGGRRATPPGCRGQDWRAVYTRRGWGLSVPWSHPQYTISQWPRTA
jgi:thioredoxin reductase (NADPH)